MYKFKRNIDGNPIEAIDEGVTQTQQLPDLTTESSFVRVTLIADTSHHVPLPKHVQGFEIDTDLNDVVVAVGTAATSLPTAVTNNPVQGTDWTNGTLAPTDRKSFTIGLNKNIYLKCGEAGEVRIHAF